MDTLGRPRTMPGCVLCGVMSSRAATAGRLAPDSLRPDGRAYPLVPRALLVPVKHRRPSRRPARPARAISSVSRRDAAEYRRSAGDARLVPSELLVRTIACQCSSAPDGPFAPGLLRFGSRSAISSRGLDTLRRRSNPGPPTNSTSSRWSRDERVSLACLPCTGRCCRPR